MSEKLSVSINTLINQYVYEDNCFYGLILQKRIFVETNKFETLRILNIIIRKEKESSIID